MLFTFPLYFKCRKDVAVGFIAATMKVLYAGYGATKSKHYYRCIRGKPHYKMHMGIMILSASEERTHVTSVSAKYKNLSYIC